jgi:predicted RNA-binding protein YlxR (DUF448 family)
MKLFIDWSLQAAGRGAYTCRTNECLNKAFKKGAFARTLRVNGLTVDLENLRSALVCGANSSSGDLGEIVHGENLGR